MNDLIPCVLLLCVSSASWPVESSLAWPWLGATLLDWCSPILLVRLTHMQMFVPGPLARWARQRKTSWLLLLKCMSGEIGSSGAQRGGGRESEVISVRTGCTGRDGGEPSGKLRRSHCTQDNLQASTLYSLENMGEGWGLPKSADDWNLSTAARTTTEGPEYPSQEHTNVLLESKMH